MAQGTDGSFLHTNLDVCVSFQWCLSGSWELSHFGSLSKTFSQWLIIPGHSFVRDLGISKPVTRTSLGHLVKFSSEVPAVSYQHRCGLPSWGGHCLKQPAPSGSRRPSPAVMLAGAGSRAVEGPLITCCPWPRWRPPSFGLPLRNIVCGYSCLHCNSIRLLFLQELEQQQQTRLPSPPRMLVPVYFIYFAFWETFYLL